MSNSGGHIKDATDDQLREIYSIIDEGFAMKQIDWDWIVLWAEGKTSHPDGIETLIKTLRSIKDGDW